MNESIAEAVMRDLDCSDVYGHRRELTESLDRHLATRHAFATDRSLLLEFIQWSVDNPGLSEDIYDDPLAADIAISEFLDSIGVIE